MADRLDCELMTRSGEHEAMKELDVLGEHQPLETCFSCSNN